MCAMRARWAAVRVVVTRARGLLTVAEAVTWAGAEEWHVAPGENPAAGEPAGEGDVPEVLRMALRGATSRKPIDL